MSTALLRRTAVPFARFSLFAIFFGFGLLKVLDLSPAGELVRALYEQTLSFPTFDTFYLLFALFECLIGILFLVPRATKFAFVLLLLHMITTFMPLFVLPEITWQSSFVPTLEGQYIIKNLALIAVGLFITTESR